jgi:hypothetical protein
MKDRLSELLRGWGTRKGSDPERLSALKERIHRSVEEEAARGFPEAAFAHPVPIRLKLAYAGLGAFGGMCAVLIVFRLLLSAPDPAVDPQDPGYLARINPAEIATGRLLFSEMEALFPSQLRWIAEANGDMGIGIEALSGAQGVETAPILVRVAVLERAGVESDWTTAWTADVFLRGDEQVVIGPGIGPGNTLTLWAHSLSDGKLALDTQLNLASPVPIDSTIHAVLTQGEPEKILSVSGSHESFLVFATAAGLGESAMSL